MRHFDRFNILTDNQHGFRKRRSTLTQLNATIQGITSKLRSGKDQVDVILLDFAKGYDKVPHQRLLYKLSFYGIYGDNLKWIEAFLGHINSKCYWMGADLNKLISSLECHME